MMTAFSHGSHFAIPQSIDDLPYFYLLILSSIWSTALLITQVTKMSHISHSASMIFRRNAFRPISRHARDWPSRRRLPSRHYQYTRRTPRLSGGCSYEYRRHDRPYSRAHPEKATLALIHDLAFISLFHWAETLHISWWLLFARLTLSDRHCSRTPRSAALIFNTLLISSRVLYFNSHHYIFRHHSLLSLSISMPA